MDDVAQSGLRALMAQFPHAGRVEWIGVRSGHRQAVLPVQALRAVADRGLEGDRRTASARPGGQRQVTLIQHEHLLAVAGALGRDAIDPALLRRNLVVSGLNLLALKDRAFRVGEALLRYTGPCHPCSRMEEVLGPGGYNAMRGHGGITAAVVEGGAIGCGDPVVVV
jgi:MOSC domain-containing protein YiiM